MTTPGEPQQQEPYLLGPQLWFGVLCEGLNRDERGRLTFQRVFNHVAYVTPQQSSGVPAHGHLNGILAVGYQGGAGQFELTVTLNDADGRELWRTQEPAVVELGEAASGAVAGIRVQQWLTQPGRYYFALALEPGHRVDQVPFEIGILKTTPDQQPPETEQG